jgi:hypothetical protein
MLSARGWPTAHDIEKLFAWSSDFHSRRQFRDGLQAGSTLKRNQSGCQDRDRMEIVVCMIEKIAPDQVFHFRRSGARQQIVGERDDRKQDNDHNRKSSDLHVTAGSQRVVSPPASAK